MPVISCTPALIAGLNTIAAAAMPAGVEVLDGLMTRGGQLREAVLIGVSSLEIETEAASTTQEWAAIGKHAREEELNVPLLFVKQTGSDDGAEARAAVYEWLGLFEAALVADYSVGGAVRWVAVASTQLRYRQLEHGWAVLLSATVAGTARLTP